MIYKRCGHWHMDVTIAGERYREALNTTDKREAKAMEKQRVSEIQDGKGTSKSGRAFARLPFGEAADKFVIDRKPHVAERTTQFEEERLKPLRKFFGDRPLLRITSEDVAEYQRKRLEEVAPRTCNMETSVLRRLLKRAKRWNAIAEEVRSLPESAEQVAKVLTDHQKQILFQTAASRDDWMVAHTAAVLAVSTTCRGVELKSLRWCDVDLFDRVLSVRRSKTRGGLRSIPLNDVAMSALARLSQRAQANGATEPEHYIFPTCENSRIDPTRPQKSWRSAWRSLVKQAAKNAGTEAAEVATKEGRDPQDAYRRASEPIAGFRFHDLRHQAVTELAESGASDATIMGLAGHLSRRMMEHYSHVRMAAKRSAVESLGRGLTVVPELRKVSPAVEESKSVQ